MYIIDNIELWLKKLIKLLFFLCILVVLKLIYYEDIIESL